MIRKVLSTASMAKIKARRPQQLAFSNEQVDSCRELLALPPNDYVTFEDNCEVFFKQRMAKLESDNFNFSCVLRKWEEVKPLSC